MPAPTTEPKKITATDKPALASTPVQEAIAALEAAAVTLDGDAGFFGKPGDAPYEAHRALAERCRKAAGKLAVAR